MNPLLERELDREIQRNARTIRAKQAQEAQERRPTREDWLGGIYCVAVLLAAVLGATHAHAGMQWAAEMALRLWGAF